MLLPTLPPRAATSFRRPDCCARCPGRAPKTGAVAVVQRTSSDLRLNPHLNVVFLDGAYLEQGTELAWRQLEHLGSRHTG